MTSGGLKIIGAANWGSKTVPMTASQAHLSDDFLDRVRRSYRLALKVCPPTRGMWCEIDRRRADIHKAATADDNAALRMIFSNPVATDLYYGVDHLCRSIAPDFNGVFVDAALGDNWRAVASRYQVERSIAILKAINGASVIESGPGMGRAAYYAFRAGITNYTTLDLPLGMVAQACFLGATLGAHSLWLPGDPLADAVGRLRLLVQPPEQMFDLAVNVDSLVEMMPLTAIRHCLWIRRHAKAFLSINRNRKHLKPRWLMSLCLSSWKREHKPFPLRSGYFEYVAISPSN